MNIHNHLKNFALYGIYEFYWVYKTNLKNLLDVVKMIPRSKKRHDIQHNFYRIWCTYVDRQARGTRFCEWSITKPMCGETSDNIPVEPVRPFSLCVFEIKKSPLIAAALFESIADTRVYICSPSVLLRKQVLTRINYLRVPTIRCFSKTQILTCAIEAVWTSNQLTAVEMSKWWGNLIAYAANTAFLHLSVARIVLSSAVC